VGLREDSSNPDHTPERGVSLVQTWLYFRLIHAITRVPINTGEFIQLNSNSDRIVLTTKGLSEHIEKWFQFMKNESSERRAAYLKIIPEVLEAVRNAFIYLVGYNESRVPPEVGFSMVILRKTLDLCLQKMFPDFPVPRDESVGDSDAYLHKHLISKGWCPRDIFRLSQSFNSNSLYYMGPQEPKQPSRDHS
jgi:hypothetical protein